MNRIIALLSVCSCAWAQGVSVTVNALGAQPLKNYTGQTIPGVRLLNTLVCPDVGTTEFSGGRIWQAAIGHGISPELPDQARLTLNRPVMFNWRNWVITAVGIGSAGMVAISTGGIVTIATKIITALAVGHVFWDQFSPILKNEIPDPSGFIQTLLDPTKLMTFDRAGDCSVTTMVAQYGKKLPGIVGPFHVGDSGAISLNAPATPAVIYIVPNEIPKWPIKTVTITNDASYEIDLNQ